MVPSRIWFLVAFVVFLGGGTGAWLLISSRLASVETGIQRVVVPGTADLTLAEPGTYTIFHEPSSVIDGKLYVSENINGLTVGVVSVDKGPSVDVTVPAGSESYSIGGHSGVAVLAFTIGSPGRYRLSASYDGGNAEPRAVLAVAHGILGRMIGAIFGGIALGLGGFVTAVAITIVTAVKRGQVAAAPPKA